MVQKKKNIVFVMMLCFFMLFLTNNVFADVYSGDIVAYAQQFIGYPYVLNTHGPNTFDCSGFVYYVFNHFGISLPYTSSSYWNNPSSYGTVVSEANALPGDVVSWSGHVGIYVGNGQMINALNPNSGVTYLQVTRFCDAGYYDNNKNWICTSVNPPHKFIRIRGVTNSQKGRLDLNGFLDGAAKGSLLNYGTVNIQIGGSLVAEGVTDFTGEYNNGTNYEIYMIKPNNGYMYEGVYSGSLTGTIGTGTTEVSLSFKSLGNLSNNWIETDFLPANVTADNCEIQYNNHYYKIAAESPGSGWIKVDSGTIGYVDDGGVYESPLELAVSSTRELVGFYYYHFCSGNTGVNADHTIRDGYVHYDEIRDTNSVIVESGYPHNDDKDPDYKYYKLKWKNGGYAYCQSGVTCDSSYGAHGTRSYYWYKMFQYQNKKAVTFYTWMKNDSGWTTSPDINATSVTIRYRLKNNSNLNKLVLPADLTEIGDSAFEGSNSIKEAVIPGGVKKIGSRAFADCRNLKFVYAPSSMSISTDAFTGSNNVVFILPSANGVSAVFARYFGIPYGVLQ